MFKTSVAQFVILLRTFGLDSNFCFCFWWNFLFDLETKFLDFKNF